MTGKPAKGMSNEGSRPIPDPTLLTTQQLLAAVAGLREILETKISGEVRIIEARLNGMDEAIRLLQDIKDKMPSEIKEKIGNLERLHNERFSSVTAQFEAIGKLSEQTKADTKTAVDAALSAQKEAAGKSEVSTTKQIDEQGRRVDDLKARVDRIEATAIGAGGATISRQASSANSWTIVGGIVGVLGFIALLAAMMMKQ